MIFITHPAFELHEMGVGHPEQPARLSSIVKTLEQQTWFGELTVMDSNDLRPASRQDLERAHNVEHIAYIERVSPRSGYASLDADTTMCASSLRAAQLAAGAGIAGVDYVMANKTSVPRAFCAVRPPGHHAERNKPMGFCLFNNIAIAALYALEHYSLERVLIVDFDVHHGNGTENIVANDERILMVSSFQTPLYPYSGTEPLGSNTINIGLDAGSGGSTLQDIVKTHWAPAIAAFRPQLIFISAGFDAHRLDPLAGLCWEVSDYAWITEWLVGQAEQFANGRIVSMLEGGYHLEALAQCACEHIRALKNLR
jgi:acetoin utilization deacetylase AcuC-like enzyme